MADSKISALAQAAALTGVEALPIVQGGATVKGSVQQLATAITGATGTNGETVTTSKPRVDLTQTWNNVATTFTGVKLNVTDTASAAGSLLADFQVGGVSKFSVDKTGFVSVKPGALSIASSDAPTTGIGMANAGNNPEVRISVGGAQYVSCKQNFVHFTKSLSLSTDSNQPTLGPILANDANNTLAQRNGVNAQTFRVYNTFTDASNYERGFMRWNSNVLEIGAEAGGTGQSRELKIVGGTQIGVGLTLSAAGSAAMDFISAGSAINLRLSGADANVQSSFSLSWASGSTVTVGNDLRIARSAASVLAINNASTGGGALQVTEMTAPAAPATNSIRIYAEDDGAGKTRLMALFATGAAQQLAIEP